MISAEKARKNVEGYKENQKAEMNKAVDAYLQSISPIIENKSENGQSYASVTCTLPYRNEVVDRLIKLGYMANVSGNITIDIKW